MSKKGKIFIKIDNRTYEFKEKKFFGKDVYLLYNIEKLDSSTYIKLNRFVRSIEFINCDFNSTSNLPKFLLQIEAYCPVKITNCNISKTRIIEIKANHNNVEIIGFETIDSSRLIIADGKKTTVDNVKNIGLDIIADDINISNYRSDLKNDQIFLLGNNVNLNNIEVYNLELANITGTKNLNWANTIIDSKHIYIKGVLDTKKLRNRDDRYIINDEKVKELLPKNSLYSVLYGLRSFISSERQCIISQKEESIRNTIDTKIEKLEKKIEDLKKSKELALSQISEEMDIDKQKVFNYTKKNTK